MHRTAKLLLLLMPLCGAAPLRAQGQHAPVAPVGPCAQVIDAGGSRLTPAISWSVRTKPREREALDRQCRTLGSIVLNAQPRTQPTGVDAVAILGWNVHVGGGDLETMLDALEAGALTGAPVAHYVLAIEEAHRSGGDLPAVPEGIGVPRRIMPKVVGRQREDIVSLAARRGLALYYAPSMRNGREAPFEDRGNAILSTMPLEELSAVELPFTRQRRVAIGARIQGHDTRGGPWSLRVVAVHLDTLAGPSRLWIFANGWRGGQARTVIQTLDQAEPSVLGGDLNTWLLGGWERAARRFAESYPQTRTAVTPHGASARGRLDYLFYRHPAPWTATLQKLSDNCGSDHTPIVGQVRFGPAPLVQGKVEATPCKAR